MGERAARLAERLREALPSAEPFELDPDELAAAVAASGADPHDHRLIAQALVEWEAMLI